LRTALGSLLALALLSPPVGADVPRPVASSVLPAPEDAPREGETIASVTVDTTAAPEARGLDRYVELRKGDPFSAQAVRHVVSLLHATGAFADVRVEATRGPAGLDLVIRPVAAPLFTRVELVGDRVLSRGRLLEVSRLQGGEPLWPARLERAARDVAVRLTEQGYLEARVTAEAVSERGGARARFRVQAGPRARVGALSLLGADLDTRAQLEPMARPAAGRPFVRSKAVKAAERMRRRLVGLGWWRATVAVRESYAPERGTVALAFEVVRGARSKVAFSGQDLPRALRHSVEDLLREGAMKPDAVEEAAERLETALQGEGHRAAQVSHQSEARGDEEVLRYDVQAGPRSTVASVTVAGAPAELHVPLATLLDTPVQDRVLTEDARHLTAALQALGYTEAAVEVQADEAVRSVPVVFRVRPGPRRLVASLKVDAPTPLPTAGASMELALRLGAPYRVEDLARDRDRLLRAWRLAGYPDVEVTPEVSTDEDGVAIVVHVQPGTRVTVDHVVVAGLQKTREEVVRREMLLDEKAPLSFDRMVESQRRLGSLEVIDRAAIAEMDPESPRARSLVVSVREAPRTTLAYGFGYSEQDLLRGTVEVTRRDLMGLDRTLTAFARVSFRGSRLLATYREPWLLGRRQDLFVTALREEEDRPAFDFTRHGVEVQTAKNLSSSWSLILRYAFQQTHSFNVENPEEVDREFADARQAGPGASVVNDTRDDPLDPHRGRYLSADLVLSSGFLGGDPFGKLYLGSAAYRGLGRWGVLALSGRMGLARMFVPGEATLLPRPDRFYAGGDFSLRGFPVDGVDPSGGNGLLLGGAEMRVGLGRMLVGAAFAETGNVYTLASDLSLSDLRYTAGVGLRYKSAVGPLRIDMGWKLDRRAGESPWRLHFTVGQAF
jgi:outer membrane protein insertion porin family